MVNKKGKFVVITGLDGSGTTTLGKFLAERDPKGYFMHTPNGIYSGIRNLFTENIREKFPVAHYHFYLSSVIAASYEIEKKLETHNVYCVRYLIDTVVSHRVMGLPIELNYDLGYYNITKPDMTIFIELDENIRKNRIEQRGLSRLDIILNNSEIRDNFVYEFNKFSSTLNVIRNNGELEDMFKQAEELIRELDLMNV